MGTVPEGSKAQYRFLGKSGLRVSNLCLGALTFGESKFGLPSQSNEDVVHQILDRYTEWGGNFVDTADVYGMGASEEIIGRWLEKQPRENVVIATKARANMGLAENANNVGLSRRHLTDSIGKSLKRLNTHYVDLYQAHWWDDGVPLEETLRTLDDLVRAGKVHYVGASNVTGWQMQKIVETSEKLGLNPVISLQQQYNLVSRESELEAFQVCKIAGIGVLPWSPLKGGLLSGKYRRNVKPSEGRLVNYANRRPSPIAPALASINDKTWEMIEAAEVIAKRHHRSLPQVAIRWLLQKDVVSSVVIGVRTLAQLDDNMGAANGWRLSQEEMQHLDELSRHAVSHPYDMVHKLNAGRTNRHYQDFYVNSKSY